MPRPRPFYEVHYWTSRAINKTLNKAIDIKVFRTLARAKKFALTTQRWMITKTDVILSYDDPEFASNVTRLILPTTTKKRIVLSLKRRPK